MGLVIYYHGLESLPTGHKQDWLEENYSQTYIPVMNYYNDNNLFMKEYNYLKNKKIDTISGSSMGGYFAFWLAKTLSVKNVILFNPALPYRKGANPAISIEGNIKNINHLMLGKNDNIIKPNDTIKFLQQGSEKFTLDWDEYDTGHRTSFEAFKLAFELYG